LQKDLIAIIFDFIHMTMSKIFSVILLIGLSIISNWGLAQRNLSVITLEAGNAITALPFVGAPQLFYTNYHPFITIGGGLVLQEKGKHAWEQTFNLGYIYHRFVQHSIPLFTETVYRFNTGKNFALRAHLGVGYLHSIPGTDRFELNDDGEYEKITNLGRAQAMAKISFSGLYRVSKDFSLSLNYGVLMQGPFVQSYVPLLPYNTIQLGVHKSLN
jgi:hypothetical protein